jgi:hypothetical protein
MIPNIICDGLNRKKEILNSERTVFRQLCNGFEGHSVKVVVVASEHVPQGNNKTIFQKYRAGMNCEFGQHS